MITPELIAAYRFHRAQLVARAERRPLTSAHMIARGVDPETARRTVQRNAALALEKARADLAAGTKRYTYAPPKFGAYARPAGSYDSAFFDTLDGSPFRLVGYADDIARRHGSRRIDHRGWYSDLDQSETLRGVVLQLPGRKGAPRFVAAREESETGGYVVELDGRAIFAGDRSEGGFYNNEARDQSAALEAATSAESFAERAAENARDYATAWRAGSYYADAGVKVRTLRRDALAILAERRKGSARSRPGRCGVIREKVESILEEIQTLRRKRRDLAAGDHGSLIFWPGDADLVAAFNDGAGARILA